jgi:transcriptional repressor NrdR
LFVNCPRCNAPTHVLESRRADDGAAVRRRRECTECGRRFTTFERREPGPLHVIKRNGTRQRFDRAKLRAALVRAAHKRPVSADEVEAIVSHVQDEAESAGGELAAERIGELCMNELRELDSGAYLQFAGTLPSVNPEIATERGRGSVRSVGKDAELPPKAASRRGNDE